MSAKGLMATVLWTQLRDALVADGLMPDTELAGPKTTELIGEVVGLMLGSTPSACRGISDSRCGYLATCGSICNKCGNVHNGRVEVRVRT